MGPDRHDEWHVVVPPRPGPGGLSPLGELPAPGPAWQVERRPTGLGRSWRPSRGFLAVVLVLVAGFGVARALGAHRTGPADRTGPGLVMSGPDGGSYAFESVHPDGEPVRWNPCEPIRYVLNLAAAPRGAEADVVDAMRAVSEATGLRFAYEGITAETPAGRRAPYQPDRYGKRWAPVLVTWHPLAQTDLPHRPDTVGVGAPVAVVSGGRTQIVSGQVVLNASRRLPAGFGTKSSWGAIVMHELAHAVGLGHVGDAGEVMYDGALPGAGRAEWGPGDREGLRRLGRAGGCLETPRPGPVVLGPDAP